MSHQLGLCPCGTSPPSPCESLESPHGMTRRQSSKLQISRAPPEGPSGHIWAQSVHSIHASIHCASTASQHPRCIGGIGIIGLPRERNRERNMRNVKSVREWLAWRSSQLDGRPQPSSVASPLALPHRRRCRHSPQASQHG